MWLMGRKRVMESCGTLARLPRSRPPQTRKLRPDEAGARQSTKVRARWPDAVTMDKIVSLCKRRGFIFQSSEIYGGLASTYDYGHYGVLLKTNVKSEWWRSMVQERDDIVAIDAAILMHPKVWEASGPPRRLHGPARAVPRRVQAALARGPSARGARGRGEGLLR